MTDEQRQFRILIVDDDPDIRNLVSQTLSRHGYAVVSAANVDEAEALIDTTPVDLMLLDVMMPGEDGLSFCRRLSQSSRFPIVILSALDASSDKIVGLELGADRYIGKPCEPRELVANIKAVLRRSRTHGGGEPESARTAEFGGWQLDLVGRYLRDPSGVVVDLATSEFLLLRYFIERPKRVLSRDQILSAQHGNAADIFDRAIDVQISRLRRKLGDSGANLIKTIRNEGYMFACPVVVR